VDRHRSTLQIGFEEVSYSQQHVETKLSVNFEQVTVGEVLARLCADWEAEAGEAKRVLVLYSEDKAHPAHGLTDNGIRQAFRSNKLFDVQIYTEYLDASRFGDLAHVRTMADFLRRKYSSMQINAIITVYPYALDFLLAERRTLFPEVPLIASAITRRDAGNLETPEVRPLGDAPVEITPATETEIDTFESLHDFQLPSEVRAWFRSELQGHRKRPWCKHHVLGRNSQHLLLD
jgi:hypothetical protein